MKAGFIATGFSFARSPCRTSHFVLQPEVTVEYVHSPKDVTKDALTVEERGFI